jgi:hypothetical protein
VPSAYTILVPQSLAIVKGWGVLEGADLVTKQHAFRVDTRLRPEMRQLTDLRDVTEMKMETEALRVLASRHPFTASAPRAFLVSSDVAFGFSRMYQMLSRTEDHAMGVFRDLDQALAHLGLSAERAVIVDALERLGDDDG